VESIFQAHSNGTNIINKTYKIKISHLREQAVMSKDSRVGGEIREIHFLLLILRR